MADAARARKVADRIHETVARLLQGRIKDPRLGFVTVTDVRVTGDLQQATVFYTVYGSDEERAASAMAGLLHVRGPGLSGPGLSDRDRSARRPHPRRSEPFQGGPVRLTMLRGAATQSPQPSPSANGSGTDHNELLPRCILLERRPHRYATGPS